MQRVNTIKWFAEEPANFEHGIGEYGSMCKQSLKEIDSKMCAFVKKKKKKILNICTRGKVLTAAGYFFK